MLGLRTRWHGFVAAPTASSSESIFSALVRIAVLAALHLYILVSPAPIV
jgi:hypothetical protein